MYGTRQTTLYLCVLCVVRDALNLCDLVRTEKGIREYLDLVNSHLDHLGPNMPGNAEHCTRPTGTAERALWSWALTGTGLYGRPSVVVAVWPRWVESTIRA